MKKLSLLALLPLLILVSGCNTVKGMGQDLQKAGSTIEGAAKK